MEAAAMIQHVLPSHRLQMDSSSLPAFLLDVEHSVQHSVRNADCVEGVNHTVAGRKADKPVEEAWMAETRC